MSDSQHDEEVNNDEVNNEEKEEEESRFQAKEKAYEREAITIEDRQSYIERYFMGIDVGSQVRKAKTAKGLNTKESLIVIYGVDENKKSAKILISGFLPYIYTQVPDNILEDQENLDKLKDGINQRVKMMKKRRELQKEEGKDDGKEFQNRDFEDIPDAVVSIVIVTDKISLKGYVPQGQKQRYMKVTAKTPGSIPTIRRLFHQGQTVADVRLKTKTYESNILYPLRFMIDKDIVGMGWFKIKKNSYIMTKPTEMTTQCSYEITCQQSAIQRAIQIPQQPDKFAKLAAVRIMSFDIECLSAHGFPCAERQTDKIIQIACVCKTSGQPAQDHKVLFALNGCAPIAGASVKNVKTEEEMLLQFQNLIKSYDPDFLIGYNIINFDLKYIIQRSRFLKMKKYGKFGRSKNKYSTLRDGTFQSKAMGMRDTKQINIEGRIQLDLMIHMHRQHKLTSYTLNNVSFHFLKKQKEDVHHSEINKLFSESMETRKRMGVYCLKDAELPLLLMEKLCCLYNYAQMARVTGVPINYLLNKGQQIKVTSQLLRKAKIMNYIMPTETKKGNNDEVAFEGACVLDPISGFYENPIATLDFASLYPSIMMAHNLCYTTLVNIPYNNREGLQKIGLRQQNVDYTVTPLKNVFVQKSKKQGLLPAILRQLIDARKKAKTQMANATDPFLKAVLEGRQLALKISANSVYGYTGALVGHLPCLQISASVTSYGREMIYKTKQQVERNYPTCRIIYGDTDSVMVQFQISDSLKKEEQIKQAMRLGKQAASKINQSNVFKKPIQLEFQKVYCPYLLITKKRYAGVYYSKSHLFSDKIEKKGIESVRRDNCLLIREMLENVIEYILQEGNKQKAQNYIKQCVSQLVQNKIDISKLVISKAITKNYQEQDEEVQGEIGKTKSKDTQKSKNNNYKTKQAHSQLAQKMKKRDENVDIHIGDRISYVMVNGFKGSKNYQNAQDPIKVMNQDIPIDYDYYIQKQIKPPLQRLLKNSGIVPNFDALFVGEHTKARYIPKLKQNSVFGKFLKVETTCTNCTVKVEDHQAFCERCKPKSIDIFLNKQRQMETLKRKYAQLWSQCQNCQGSLTEEVICQNMDCPIYYRRVKYRNDIADRLKTMKRLQESGESF